MPAHLAYGRLSDDKSPTKVAKIGIQLVDGVVRKRLHLEYTCVVDQNINSAETVDGGVDNRVSRLRLRDVSDNDGDAVCFTKLLGRLSELCLGPAVQDDVVALLEKLLGDGITESGRASGDNDRLWSIVRAR